MDSPKRMANSITGRKASTGPVRLTPITLPSHPHWNTAVRIPKAAAADTRFMTAAVRGTATLRNTVARRKKDRTTTTPMKRGSLEVRTRAKSVNTAVVPPT